MAYRYNEKTGEFEDVPKKTPSENSKPSTEDSPKLRYVSVLKYLITILLVNLMFAGLASMCS